MFSLTAQSQVWIAIVSFFSDLFLIIIQGNFEFIRKEGTKGAETSWYKRGSWVTGPGAESSRSCGREGSGDWAPPCSPAGVRLGRPAHTCWRLSGRPEREHYPQLPNRQRSTHTTPQEYYWKPVEMMKWPNCSFLTRTKCASSWV